MFHSPIMVFDPPRAPSLLCSVMLGPRIGSGDGELDRLTLYGSCELFSVL